MRYLAELVDELHGLWGLAVVECDEELECTGRSLFGDGLSVGPRENPCEVATVRLRQAQWLLWGSWLGVEPARWLVEVVPQPRSYTPPPPAPRHEPRAPTTALPRGSPGVPSRLSVAGRGRLPLPRTSDKVLVFSC